MLMLYYILLLLSGLLCFIYLAIFKIKEKEVHQNLSLSFAICLILLIGGRFACDSISSAWKRESKSEKITRAIMEMGGFYLGKYISDLKIDIGRKKILIIDYPSDIKLYGSGYSSSVIEDIRRGLKSGSFSISSVENASALFTIMMPGLVRAREIAKKIYCLNNLDQTTKIARMYNLDYGQTPYSSTWLIDFSFLTKYVQNYGIMECPEMDDSVTTDESLVGGISYHYMGSRSDWEKK